jgi:hypothetical protein
VHELEGLYAVLQPTLLAVEARGKRSVDAAAMAQALLHTTVHEWSKARLPRYPDKELAHDILAMLRARRWRGHLSGLGHSKRRPLLTRLVGGMKMWKGERAYRELPDPTAKGEPKSGEPKLGEGKGDDEQEGLDGKERDKEPVLVQFAQLTPGDG